MNIKLTLVISVMFCLCQAAQRQEKPADKLELNGDLRFQILYDDTRKLDNQAIGQDRIQVHLRARAQTRFKLTS